MARDLTKLRQLPGSVLHSLLSSNLGINRAYWDSPRLLCSELDKPSNVATAVLLHATPEGTIQKLHILKLLEHYQLLQQQCKTKL